MKNFIKILTTSTLVLSLLLMSSTSLMASENYSNFEALKQETAYTTQNHQIVKFSLDTNKLTQQAEDILTKFINENGYEAIEEILQEFADGVKFTSKVISAGRVYD